MREIEFRGKRVDNGEGVYGHHFRVGASHFIISLHCVLIDIYPSPFIRDFVEVIPETVGQYTSLKEKKGKGKKAYHHDVVEICVSSPWVVDIPVTIKGEIVWLNSGWWFDGQETNEWNSHLSDLPHWEIIGNIHDNPELLEAQK